MKVERYVIRCLGRTDYNDTSDLEEALEIKQAYIDEGYDYIEIYDTEEDIFI